MSTTIEDAELALITAGWEQLPSGKWRHPSMIQGGRCRPLTTEEATKHKVLGGATDGAQGQGRPTASPVWCAVPDGDPED